MSNTFKNDITKFNDKYLKCIVTKYSSVTEYLGNSGSLIVLQQPSNGMNRNYVYLGDEFLASGYGFGTKAAQEKGERIVSNYDNDIKDIYDYADNNVYNPLYEMIKNIINDLDQYVKIDGGHIDDTVITIDGKDIKLIHLILHGEEATYKNLEVTDIKKWVNGIEVKNDTVLLPVGSYINEIKIQIQYRKNDSGGIRKLEVAHSNLYADSKNDNVLINYDDVNDNEENSGFGTITYIKTISNSRPVDKFIPNIINSMWLNVGATPESNYKNYPSLEEIYGIHIPSIGNKIQNNTLRLNTCISIRPQFYLHYSFGTYMHAAFKNTKAYPLNSFVDHDVTKVVMNFTNNTIYIAVPYMFAIRKVWLINDKFERYDWSGALMLKSGIDVIAWSNTLNQNKMISSNIYCLDAVNTSSNTPLKLEIEVIYKNAKLANDGDPDTDYYANGSIPMRNEEQVENIGTYNNAEIWNDEEFNNMYWVKTGKMADLRDTLDRIKENGIR